MADDETTEIQDTPQEPADEAPVADEPVAETPAEEPVPEAPAEEPAADEPVAEEAPAEEAEAPADEPVAQDAPAEPAEPEEQLSSKERKRRERSTHTEAKPVRTIEERQAERAAERTAANAARSRRRKQEREKARAAGGPKEGTPTPEHVPGTPQVRQGIVVSSKADKTVTVSIDYAKRHRRYQKIVRTSKTLHAHDERNDAREGDTVRVVECRPMSRTKRWRLDEILERAK